MKQRDVQRILKETAYVRMGGSAEELRCANYIKDECAKLGADAQIESFEVDMADILECELTADGIKIPCKGYFNAGNACIEAPFYYLRDNSAYSLSLCKDHIVMIDGYMGYWKYQDLIETVPLDLLHTTETQIMPIVILTKENCAALCRRATRFPVSTSTQKMQ